MITVELKNADKKQEFLSFLQEKRVAHYNGTHYIMLDYITSDKVQETKSGCAIQLVWHTYTITDTPVIIRCANTNTIIYDAAGGPIIFSSLLHMESGIFADHKSSPTTMYSSFPHHS